MIFVVFGFVSFILAGLGLGGGVILIPALTQAAGLSLTRARYICLLAYIPASVGVILKGRKNVSLKTVKYVPWGMAGALFGSAFVKLAQDDIIRKAYAIFIICFGIYVSASAFLGTKNKKVSHKAEKV